MDLKDLGTKLLILSHPLTNFEIQKYYPKEPRMESVLEIIYLIR